MQQLSFNFDLAEVISRVNQICAGKAIQVDGEKITFSDEEIVFLTYRLLEDAFQVLARSSDQKTRSEILEWIYAPDFQVYQGALTHAQGIPFSFQFCCRLLGYRADEMQKEIEKTFQFEGV